MKNKLLTGFLCLVLMLTLALPACTTDPAASPTSPPAPTSAPAADLTSAPASAPTSAPAAAPAITEPLKIGLLLPFTGFDPRNAPQMEAATRMALDKANWTVVDRKIELFVEDEANDPQVGVEKARKLVEENQVDVLIGALFGNVVVAVAGYAEKAGVAYAPYVPQSMSTITTAPNNTTLPEGTLKGSTYPAGLYAAEVKGYKTATILYSDYIAGEEYVGGFVDGFEEKGGTIIQSQAVPLGTVDFAPFITSLQQADCVAFWFAGTMGPFLKQYYDFGIDMPVVANAPWCIEMDVMNELGDTALGVFGSGHATERTPDTALNREFVELSQKQLGQVPTFYMYSAFVTTSTLLEAIKATNGETSPEKLIPAWRQVKVDTPMGTISFDEEGCAIGDLYVFEFAKEGDEYYWKAAQKYEQMPMKVPGE